MKQAVFHIVDPGMTIHLGHHRAINMAIASGMRARGYEVRVWVHQAYRVPAQEKALDGIEVIPCFSVSPYAVFKANDVNELTQRHGHAAKLFLNEINQLNLTGMVHISNLFASQFLGLSALKNIKLSACVHHHPSRYSVHGETLWIQAWTAAGKKLNSMKILVVEPQMVNEIDRCTDTKKGVVLAPFPLPAPCQLKPQDSSKRIGILGGMRREQGLNFLEPTIDAINSFDYEVLLHDVKGVFSDKFKSKNVQLVGYSEKFSDVLAKCEAVLLNYDPVAYRFMGSGVWWEAAANGIPTLYSRGTAMSTNARHYGFGLSFVYGDQSSVVDTMATYVQHHETIHKNSKIIAQKLRAEHGLSRYLDHLINE